ncbi:MAG: TolC family protein [Candidatus Electrothrix sp. GW3-4]|uniref:TolC family protein n=1 Tax=Candidatus Electrothrix sp. GW3-4 TaxID=3126740 RepID=UPI0030D193D9
MKQSIIIVIALCLLAAPGQTREMAKTGRYDLAQIELLDVETAQRIALQDNPGLGAAQARLEQARAGLQQAVAADKPRVDANASTGLGRYSDTNYDSLILSDSSADQNYEAGSLALQASWLLFDGYARKFQQEQARYGVQSSDESRRNIQRLLVSAVADAFFHAQLALAAIEIATANKAFYERQLQDAESRLEVGSGSLSDVLNMKVQLNSAQNSLLISQRDYEAARYALAALLGIADSVLPKTIQLAALDKDCDIFADKGLTDGEKLIAEALQARPDLTALAMQIKGAESAIEQAKAGNWPTVQLVGQLDGSTTDGLAPGGEDLGASLGVNVSWNLYSGGAVDAAVLEARQAKREARYAYADLRNSIAAEVQQDIVRLAAAREQVRLQRETVELVEENRKLAKSEYEAGSASLVRLNEAQRDLTATYGQLAQALVSYQQARHQLLAAVARNLEPFSLADKSQPAK